MRRGDNIPTVAEYAHWNEEAESMWYAENRYDMEHADEELDDEYERQEDPFEEHFETQGEAIAFMIHHELRQDCDGVNLSDWGGKWYVEHYDEKAHKAQLRKRQ